MRIYCIQNDIDSVPICANSDCNNHVKWGRGRFTRFCSNKCSLASSETKEKRIQTFMDKFGVDNPSRLKSVREKAKNTMIKRYGVESALKSDIFREKSKETSLQRYGVDIPSKSPKVKEKIKETNVKRYGVACTLQDKSTQEKIKITLIDRYGVDNPLKSKDIRDKVKQTNILRYGGTGFASEELSNKQKETMMALYGVEHSMQMESTRMKAKETCLLRYGVENYTQSEEWKDYMDELWKSMSMDERNRILQLRMQTNMSKYGVAHYILTDEFRQKCRITCIERYGVDHYSKTRDYQLKLHKRYVNSKYPDISFSSKWEFLVYDFLIEHSILFEYQIEPIPYEYDGETHYYFPDFKVNGRLYEVKGDQFFRINESTGEEEMFCPYRYPECTDEHYEWKCGQYEAKHQCMIANNVIILRKKDIDNLSLETFNLSLEVV